MRATKRSTSPKAGIKARLRDDFSNERMKGFGCERSSAGRQGHGQAGVSCVPATSGATSTRSLAGRCVLCSVFIGCYIDEDLGRNLCSGYVGGDIDEAVEMTRRRVACH